MDSFPRTDLTQSVVVVAEVAEVGEVAVVEEVVVAMAVGTTLRRLPVTEAAERQQPPVAVTEVMGWSLTTLSLSDEEVAVRLDVRGKIGRENGVGVETGSGGGTAIVIERGIDGATVTEIAIAIESAGIDDDDMTRDNQIKYIIHQLLLITACFHSSP